VLRVLNRFQKAAGVLEPVPEGRGGSTGRSPSRRRVTATIPLAIVTTAIASQLGGKSTADRIIERYELTGSGAAVEDIFAPPAGVETSLGIIGLVFLLLAVLSFTRTVQRLFEQTWELDPLSVRNTGNRLLWIGGLAL
jgi:uncharacterized BrkB/YihY/UPF0761 family membrane protein